MAERRLSDSGADWTWDGVRRSRLLESADWPLSRKLAWLEDAAALALRLARAQKDHRPGVEDSANKT